MLAARRSSATADPLGSCTRLVPGVQSSPWHFRDYQLTVDEQSLPNGITLTRLGMTEPDRH